MTTPVEKTGTDPRCLNQEVIARTDIYSEITLRKIGEELELCYHRLPSHEDTFTKYVISTLKDGPAKDGSNRVSMRLSFYSKEGERIEHRFTLDPNKQALMLQTAQELDSAYGKMAGLTLTIPEEEMIRAEIDRRIELVAPKYEDKYRFGNIVSTVMVVVFGGMLTAGVGISVFKDHGLGGGAAIWGPGGLLFLIALTVRLARSATFNSEVEKESGADKWREVLEKYSPPSGPSAFLPPSFSTSSGMYSSSGTQFSLGFRW